MNSSTKNSMPVTSTARITLYEHLDQLESLRGEIDSLTCSPFLKCSWMIPWIRTFCDSACRLQFLLVRDDQERLLGFAPLVLKSSFKRARYLAFVGSGKACADYMEFPAKRGHEQTVIDAVAQWLRDNESMWDRIELDGVRATDAHMANFVAKMESLDFENTTVETLPSFRMQLPDSWDQLLTQLSKNSRKKYRRMERQLDGSAQLYTAKDADSLHEGLRILEYLHTRRWKSLGGEGCFAHSGFREFLRDVARQKLDEGKLSLIWMTWKDAPVAADIAWREGSGLFTYQGGISPEHLDIEPGKAILKCQFELAMEQGLKFVDFLRGDEPYKSRYPSAQTENVRYELIGKSSRARMSQTMLRLGRSARQWKIFDDR